MRAAAPATRSFNLPAAAANEALKAFSAQSGREVIYPTGVALGVRTRAVQGNFTASEAIARLLEGTGLVAKQDENSGAFTVMRASDPNAPRAVPAPASDRPILPAASPVRDDGPSRAGSTGAGRSRVTNEDAADPIQLSAFEVTADQDVGYQGGNTTSGSRLNTSLRDTAAAIMVITPEFISDFGMNDLADLTTYASNAQTDLDENRANSDPGNMRGASNGDPPPRIRGLKASVGMDFFDAYVVPVDNYNIERVEFASGPNSILFGRGAPGGLLNLTTKRARLERNRTSFRLQGGDFHFARGEMDHNQIVIPNRLAVRLNGLIERSNGWRKWSAREIDRGAASVRYAPWRSTSITVNFEKGRHILPLNMPLNALDGRLLWQASGSRVLNDADWLAADRASGVNRNTTVRTIYATDATGGAPLLLTASNTAGSRLLDSTFEDINVAAAQRAGNTQVPQSVLPYSVNTYGPTSTRTTRFQRLFVNVEHAFTDDFRIDVAYLKLQASGKVLAPINNQTFLYGDSNTVIPNPAGTGPAVPNPNVRRLFLDTRWGVSLAEHPAEAARISSAHKLKLGRFGTHDLAAMAQRETRRHARMNQVDILVDQNNVPFSNVNAPQNEANQITRRHYVDPADFSTWTVGTALEPVSFVRGGRTFHNVMVNEDTNPGDFEYENNSLLAATQSRFFDSRVIVTLGLRHDDITTEQHAGGTARPTDPDVISGQTVANTVKYLPEIAATFRTKSYTRTAGAVYHATRWLGLFYNYGTNNGEPNQVASILPLQVLPPPSDGTTNDYGFMLNLLDGKIFLRATAFKTSLQTQAQGISLGTIRAPTLDILDTLLANNRISAQEHAQHVLNPSLNLQASYDMVNTGFELSNWFNLSRNFTAQVNFSYTKTDRSNIAPEYDTWFAAEREFWLRTPGAGNLVNPTAASSVNQSIEAIETAVQETRNFNNFGFGNNPYKANIAGRYSFTEGRFKGIFLGGGSRWVSRAKIGRVIAGRDARGNTTYGSTIHGPIDFKIDAFLGYRRQIEGGARKARLTFQVNVSNLTDEDDVMPLRLNTHYSGYLRVLLPEPRRIRFTTALEF